MERLATAEEIVENKIFLIRGQKVMIDRDLADLYGVKTKYLNQQVRRNLKRFPETFMFQLTKGEQSKLVAICNRFKTMKHSTIMPYVFTEHGVAMLSAVLRSDKAIKISIIIINTFIKLREIISSHKELAQKLSELEQRVSNHDSAIADIFKAIRQLMSSPKQPKRKIGFHA